MRDNIGKYRGVRIDNGELAYGWLVDVAALDSHCSALRIVQQLKDGLMYVPVIPETVGEYTGIKDDYVREFRDMCKERKNVNY